MKRKRTYQIILLVLLAALLCGCGRGGREVTDREKSDDRQEESVPEESSTEESSTEEAVEEPLISSAFASAKPGNELQFGTLEQDNNLSNGAEPIEWVVLANEGDKILVLSKYVLGSDMKCKYDDELTWERSEEREWLNNTFYEEVFSEEEKLCIPESNISTPDTDGKWKERYNQPFQTYGGADTVDHLFFLSYDEVKKYVQPLGIATAETVEAFLVYRNKSTGYSRWLLRSPGGPESWPDGDDYTVTARGYSARFAAIDSENGNMYEDASDGTKDLFFISGRLDTTGMRPAMWLSVR